MPTLLQQTLAAVEQHGGLVDDHQIDRSAIAYRRGFLVLQNLHDHRTGATTPVVTLMLDNVRHHSVNVVEIDTHGVAHVTKHSVLILGFPVYSVGEIQDYLGERFIDAAAFNL